jgi:D-aminoacyl-tRNA deacylase
MRAVLQRVSRASVRVDGNVVGRLDGPGIVVLVGVTHDDGSAEVEWLARKVRDLRIMREERSIAELDAPVLVVSQFTLYGDAHKGRRPTWAAAAPSTVAEPLYDALCAELERLGTPVQRGVFGSQMSLELVNDGPVTVMLDSAKG